MSVVPGAMDACQSAGKVALPEADFIAVGLSPEDLETPAVRTPAGPSTTSESADITCAIRSWGGGTDIRSRRERAYELLAEIRAEVDEDNTLGGAVGQAEVAGSVYMPSQGKRGVVVDVVVTVRVLAF